LNDFPKTTRRQFLALTGVGIAALGTAGWAQNRVEFDPEIVTNTDYMTDVLVIGGGMAGLFAGVKAHDAGAATMIVSKGRLGSSGLTPFAKGFFVFDPAREQLSIDEFAAKVQRSALGTANSAFTKQLAQHAADRARELTEWGFFDQVLANRPFMTPVEARGIPLIERVTITHLIEEGGRVVGAAGFRLDSEQTVTIRARTVVLCTGAGGFKPNGFPVCDLTHDGTIMAYEIGAKVTGKEWNDGHGTRSVNPAACYDNWGDMFERVPSTNGVEVHHDLGVDISYQAYMGGNPVKGGPGAPPQDEAEMIAGGPYVPEEFRRRMDAPPPGAGGDGPPPPPPGFHAGATVGGASAGMAIHKSEGLVPVNETGLSTMPGLYAAGDALGSHMAGGIYTQIGSSLAGSAVQGAIAGEAAAIEAATLPDPAIPDERLEAIRAEILSPLRREAGYGPAWVTQTLQGIMIPNFVLYIKKAAMMQAALAYVEELRNHHVPMLRAANMHELRLAHETRNMVLSAEMKLRASLMRTESRCSHFRLDYPEVDDVNWRVWINIHKGEDGRMALTRQPFGTWPS
jgi:succinate dehydrogenase/fumarate reductase flavoprotein subunit